MCRIHGACLLMVRSETSTLIAAAAKSALAGSADGIQTSKSTDGLAFLMPAMLWHLMAMTGMLQVG